MTDTGKTILGMLVAAVASVAIAYVPNKQFAENAVNSKISGPDVTRTLHQMIDTDVTRTVADRASIPKGTIIAWYAKSGTIPDGWVVCDGSNGTPNLVDRFVMGAANLAANGNPEGSGKGHVTLPGHHHDLAVGQMTRPTLATRGEPIKIDPSTQLPNYANGFTNDAGSGDFELSQVPASVKILFLMKT